MSADSLQHRWYQFHWITTLLLVIAFAILIWANVITHDNAVYGRSTGWPFVYSYTIWPNENWPKFSSKKVFDLGGCIGNATFAMLLLCALTVFSESILRRATWFRFHLSTALVLLFTIGGLLAANFADRSEKPIDPFEFNFPVYGWPFSCTRGNTFQMEELRIEWFGAAANLAVALLILALVTFLCEFAISRNRHD